MTLQYVKLAPGATVDSVPPACARVKTMPVEADRSAGGRPDPER
jgi:hypothetical protein